MKKIIFFSALFFLIGGILVLKDNVDNIIAMNKESNNWTTYTKKDSKITQSPSTQSELKKIGADVPAKKSLVPKRSISSVQIRPKNIETFKGRRIIGHLNKKISEMNFINKVNQDWKDKLSSKLLQHRKKQAKLFIKSEKSVIKIQNGSARYLELVNITFLFKGDDSNSFKAFVDSETGEVLQTWSRSIHDRVGVKKMKFTPDGTL
jgi:hypothetical protein